MNAAKIRPIAQYYAIERVLMAHPDGILPRELAFQTHLSLATITAWLYRLQRLGGAVDMPDGRWRALFADTVIPAQAGIQAAGIGGQEASHDQLLDRRHLRLHRRIRSVLGNQRPRRLV